MELGRFCFMVIMHKTLVFKWEGFVRESGDYRFLEGCWFVLRSRSVIIKFTSGTNSKTSRQQSGPDDWRAWGFVGKCERLVWVKHGNSGTKEVERDTPAKPCSEWMWSESSNAACIWRHKSPFLGTGNWSRKTSDAGENSFLLSIPSISSFPNAIKEMLTDWRSREIASPFFVAMISGEWFSWTM